VSFLQLPSLQPDQPLSDEDDYENVHHHDDFDMLEASVGFFCQKRFLPGILGL
jgi:hypothetical protein